MLPGHSSWRSATDAQEGALRLVRAQAQPGQVEAVARRWQDFWGAQMPQIPGFRHAYFAAGREADAIVSISIWERKPDQATMEPLMQQFQAQVRDVSASPPTVEE